VDDGTVVKFANQIKDNGPHARFMTFLRGLASCNGKQILGNQELLLKIVFSQRKEVPVDETQKQTVKSVAKGKAKDPFATNRYSI
jgi:hypothetical protein